MAALLSMACVEFAPPPPMFTLGGPGVTSPKASEVALAAGTGVAFFDDAHAWATGWAGRFNRGIGADTDLGIDVASVVHSSDGTLTAKIQARHALSPRLRLEAGVGAADDSDGKSLHADVGITTGTVDRGPWDFYTSLRLGGAAGLPGDVIFGDGVGVDPPDAWFGALIVGAEGEVSTTQSVLLEGGFGTIAPVGHQVAPFFTLSAGFRVLVGGREPSP